MVLEISQIDQGLAQKIWEEHLSCIKRIENTFDCSISYVNDHLFVNCETPDCIDHVVSVLEEMLQLSDKLGRLNDKDVEYLIELDRNDSLQLIKTIKPVNLGTNFYGRSIRGKSLGQSIYLSAIHDYELTFVLGPAGTGKTYLAIASAIASLKAHEIERIILTRPAIEAGEKLGFLPGDITQKADPYLRPLYDAIIDILGLEAFQRLQEKGVIEIAPLAYMRGRTLTDAFIILDESQNTTREQMKMFLTRLGLRSKAVVTGDPSQTDLPKNKTSGLSEAIKVLTGIPQIAIVELQSMDIVRHDLVLKIVEAYTQYEAFLKEEDTREQSESGFKSRLD